MFPIESNVPYVQKEKEVKGNFIAPILNTCLLLKPNESFLIPKDSIKFKKKNWEDKGSKSQVLSYIKSRLKLKLNMEEYKISVLDTGIRIWYKPTTTNNG